MSDSNNNGGKEPSNNTPNPQDGPPNSYGQHAAPQSQEGQAWQQQQPTAPQYSQPEQGSYQPQYNAQNPQQGATQPYPAGGYSQQAYGVPPTPQGAGYGGNNGYYQQQTSQNFSDGEKKSNKTLIIILSILAAIVLLAAIIFGAGAFANANKPAPVPPVVSSEEPVPTPTEEEEAPPVEEEPEAAVELQTSSLVATGADGTVFTYGPTADSGWTYVKEQDGMAAYQSADAQCQVIVTSMPVPTNSGDDTADTDAFLRGFVPSFGGDEADIDATLQNTTISTTTGETFEMGRVITTSKGQEAAIFSRVLGESDLVFTHVIMCVDTATLDAAIDDASLGQAIMIDAK